MGGTSSTNSAMLPKEDLSGGTFSWTEGYGISMKSCMANHASRDEDWIGTDSDGDFSANGFCITARACLAEYPKLDVELLDHGGHDQWHGMPISSMEDLDDEKIHAWTELPAEGEPGAWYNEMLQLTPRQTESGFPYKTPRKKRPGNCLAMSAEGDMIVWNRTRSGHVLMTELDSRLELPPRQTKRSKKKREQQKQRQQQQQEQQQGEETRPAADRTSDGLERQDSTSTRLPSDLECINLLATEPPIMNETSTTQSCSGVSRAVYHEEGLLDKPCGEISAMTHERHLIIGEGAHRRNSSIDTQA